MCPLFYCQCLHLIGLQQMDGLVCSWHVRALCWRCAMTSRHSGCCHMSSGRVCTAILRAYLNRRPHTVCALQALRCSHSAHLAAWAGKMQSPHARRRAPHSCSLGFGLGHGSPGGLLQGSEGFHHGTLSCSQGAAHVLSPLHHAGTLGHRSKVLLGGAHWLGIVAWVELTSRVRAAICL